MTDRESHQAFRAYARTQQERVERLLSASRASDLAAGETTGRPAAARWTEEVADPEFRKNLSILFHLIAGATGISERKVDVDRDDLRDLITLPSDIPLTLKVLLARRFELEQKLVEIGDEQYLRGRAADLYDEREGTSTRWKQLFVEPPPLLRATLGRVAGDDTHESEVAAVEKTRQMLARLLAVKEALDLPVRARRELKLKTLRAVVPAITAATILFGVAIGAVEGFDDSAVLLAAAAGATGAALGGLIKLRDEVNLGAQIRAFLGFYVGEIVVGAAAGLLAYVTVHSGVVKLGGGDYGTAAFAFAVGFSEAAFLGLVGTIAERAAGAKQNEKPAEAKAV